MVKNLPANAGNVGLIPGSGRAPEEGDSNPLQYSCLGNPMDNSSWSLKELYTTEQLHNNKICSWSYTREEGRYRTRLSSRYEALFSF